MRWVDGVLRAKWVAAVAQEMGFTSMGASGPRDRQLRSQEFRFEARSRANAPRGSPRTLATERGNEGADRSY